MDKHIEPIKQFKPDYSICFFRDGKQIGRFDFNQTPATFDGEVNECAKLFVTEVLRIMEQTEKTRNN